MDPRTTPRVAVIGSGVGGLTVTLGLHRSGIDVRLFERYPEIKSIGGGIALWPPPLKALELLGLDITEFGAESVPAFSRPDGRIIAQQPSEIASIDTPLWLGAMRTTVFEALREAIPDDIVYAGKNCVQLEQNADSATAFFEDGTSFEADLIIGADGLRSVVRGALEGQKPLRDHNLTVWIGHTFAEAGDRSVARLSLDPKGYQCSFVPMKFRGKDGWHWWVMERTNAESPTLTREQMKERSLEISKDVAGPMCALIEATEPADIIPWEIRDRPPLAHWYRGRIAVLGDAAHPTSPYAGYGLGMAIVDGFYLACALAGVDLRNRTELEGVLREYQNVRKGPADSTVEFAYMMGKLMHTKNPVKRFVRDTLLDRTPFLQKQLAKQYGDPLISQYQLMVDMGRRLPTVMHED